MRRWFDSTISDQFYTRLADRLCTGPTHQPERFDSSVAYQFNGVDKITANLLACEAGNAGFDSRSSPQVYLLLTEWLRFTSAKRETRGRFPQGNPSSVPMSFNGRKAVSEAVNCGSSPHAGTNFTRPSEGGLSRSLPSAF